MDLRVVSALKQIQKEQIIYSWIGFEAPETAV